jgi:hypothetical protein
VLESIIIGRKAPIATKKYALDAAEERIAEKLFDFCRPADI